MPLLGILQKKTNVKKLFKLLRYQSIYALLIVFDNRQSNLNKLRQCKLTFVYLFGECNEERINARSSQDIGKGNNP